MKARLAVIVCIMIMTVFLLTPYTYAVGNADNNVGIKVSFDKEKYVTGETATATLTLTGLDDEKTDGLCLGAFETHLKFNASPAENNLEYVSDGSDFSSSLKTYLESDSTMTSGIVFNVATRAENKNIFVISFDSQKGIPLNDDTIDTSGNLVIGTIKFKVNAEKGSTVGVSIESNDYKNVVTKPFGTEDKGEEYKCNVFEDGVASAQVVGALLENPFASFSFKNSEVSGSVDVRLADSVSGVLQAVLRDTSTDRIKQTKTFDVSSSGKYNVKFEGISNISNLKVEYYLFESMSDLKPLTDSVSAEVTGAVMNDPQASFSGNIVSGTVNVNLPVDESCVLLAVLRDTSTGLVKGSKIQTADSSNIYSVLFEGITNKSALKVEYYLWSSLSNMKAVAGSVSAEVTDGN